MKRELPAGICRVEAWICILNTGRESVAGCSCFFSSGSEVEGLSLFWVNTPMSLSGVSVTGGFGASANSRGSAVFCTNLHTGKSTRYERMDVMGEVKPERLPEWAKEKAQELLHKKRNKDKER